VRFADKVALITGSSRGIGRAIALRLASEGARIGVNYRRNTAEAERVAAEIVQRGSEALLLQAEQDLQKARHLEGPRGEPADVAAYERVYSKTFAELTAEYRIETGASLGSNVSQAELAAFTYWCSKYRFRLAEPARVASDTRKALALLSRLEAARAPRERRVPSPEPAEIIEL